MRICAVGVIGRNILSCFVPVVRRGNSFTVFSVGLCHCRLAIFSIGLKRSEWRRGGSAIFARRIAKM